MPEPYTPELAPRPTFTRPGAAPVLAPVYLPASILPRPALDYDVRRGVWYLAEPYRITFQGWRLWIPEHVTLDLASVPRVLWPLLASHELGLVPPLLHDRLYELGGDLRAWSDPPRRITREDADRLFLWAMEREGVDPDLRKLAYRAVRRFGAPSWEASR